MTDTTGGSVAGSTINSVDRRTAGSMRGAPAGAGAVAGVPGAVHERADARVRIPLRPGLRSLNVAVAGAMLLQEALRQTGAFPDSPEVTSTGIGA